MAKHDQRHAGVLGRDNLGKEGREKAEEKNAL
jgi:hypothetical protein